MIFLDGVYVDRGGKVDRFRRVKAPSSTELSQLTRTIGTIAHRIGRYLKRQGLLVRDTEQSYLALGPSDEGPEDSMNQLQGHSITYRIAVGPHQGRRVLTLQTLPGSAEPFVDTADGVTGFSLHASVAVKVSDES